MLSAKMPLRCCTALSAARRPIRAISKVSHQHIGTPTSHLSAVDVVEEKGIGMLRRGGASALIGLPIAFALLIAWFGYR
jgi:hypothetical protein